MKCACLCLMAFLFFPFLLRGEEKKTISSKVVIFDEAIVLSAKESDAPFNEEGLPLLCALKTLKEKFGLKVAFLTSSSPEEMQKKLERAHLSGLTDLFFKKENLSTIPEACGVSPSKCLVFVKTAEVTAVADKGMLALAMVSPEEVDVDISAAKWAHTVLSKITPRELAFMGMEIKIYKSKRVLEVYSDEVLLFSFPIGIGKSSLGSKEKEGDGKTPEGEYLICTKNLQSQYHLSLGINYPNNRDAKEGLEKKLLSLGQYEAICKANAQKKRPPFNTPLGGEIYIHGSFEKGDGSRGCIRMYEADVEKLYAMTSLGTKVFIFP